MSFHGWNLDPWKRHQIFFKKKNKFSKHWKYEIENLGFKYNMNDFTAAVGLAQLNKINFFNKKKNMILKKYLDGIKKSKKHKASISL